MTLEEIERLLATDYGIQALNTHHVRWLVAEVKAKSQQLDAAANQSLELALKYDKMVDEVVRLRAELASKVTECSAWKSRAEVWKTKAEVLEKKLYPLLRVPGSPGGCRRKLAPGHWWGFCGETDMGQTAPALCIECGGEYKLAEQVKE